jgi:hypothetical protein
MRAAPPLAFTVRRFGAWRAALVALGLGDAAAMAAWWHRLEEPAGWAGLVLAAALACALLPLVQAWRLHPLALRWDGTCWHVDPARAVSGAPRTGRLAVALDLGTWMLLRFVVEPPASPAVQPPRAVAATWIALQRRGLETEWHAIRCTVYSPPPAGPPEGVPAQPPE